MVDLKTKAIGKSVEQFLRSVKDKKKRDDCLTVLKLMKQVTRTKPKMWGPSIIGFGTYHYKYESGHEGDFFLTGFSPRAQSLTLYIMAGFARYDSLMKRLGKFKTGKSCLYIKSLDDVNMSTLKKLIEQSVKQMKKKCPWIDRLPSHFAIHARYSL